MNYNLEDDDELEILDLYQLIQVSNDSIEINLPFLNKPITMTLTQLQNFNDEYIDMLDLNDEQIIDWKYLIREIKDIVDDKIDFYQYFNFV